MPPARDNDHSALALFAAELQAAALPAAVAVRDSKDPDGPKLIFTVADWTAFTAAIRASA